MCYLGGTKKMPKKKDFSFKVIAIGIVAILTILGIFSAVALSNAGGVYTKEKVGDLDIKATGVYQFVKDTQSVEDFKDISLEIENTNTAKDYNLKLVYTYENKSETVFIDVLAGDKEKAKINLISANDIDGLGVYTKTISIMNGETVVKTITAKFSVGTVEVDDANSMRVPTLEVAQYNADSMVMYVDINDTATLSDIEAKEDLNLSKVTVTGVSYDVEELNSNKWAKVTINYESKGSVLKDELYTAGFDVDLTLTYDSLNETKSVVSDFVRTGALEDFVVKQNTNFGDLTLIN